MSAEGEEFDSLVVRFHMLGKADREAVLATLSDRDRAWVLSALADHRKPSEVTGARYLAYSPWLGQIISRATSGRDDSSIPEATRRAIIDADAAVAKGHHTQASLWEHLTRLGKRLLDGMGSRHA